MIQNALVKNIYAILYKAEDFMFSDDTMWGSGGMGDYPSGLMKRVEGKPNITTVVQIFLVTFVVINRHRSHIHCHKLNKKKEPFTKEIINEMWLIFRRIKHLIVECKENPPP